MLAPRSQQACVCILTSNKIMSAASLDTSEPAIPMATPMSAFLRAGESLTPSPVTPTTLPLAPLHYEQLLLRTCPGESNLCEGQDELVQVGLIPVHHNSSLVTVGEEIIPTSLTMAWAVMGWSPVTMITLMPALLHLETASGTEAWEGRSCSSVQQTSACPG